MMTFIVTTYAGDAVRVQASCPLAAAKTFYETRTGILFNGEYVMRYTRRGGLEITYHGVRVRVSPLVADETEEVSHA